MPEAQRTVASPVGDLLLTASETGLTGVYFPMSRKNPLSRRSSSPHLLTPASISPPPRSSSPISPHPLSPSPFGSGGTSGLLDRVEAQLNEYFAGSRTTFDLP